MEHLHVILPLILVFMAFILKLVVDKEVDFPSSILAIIELPIDLIFLAITFYVATILSNFSDIPQVQSAFKAIRVCVFILILSAILKLRKKSVFDVVTIIVCALVFVLATFTEIPLFIFVIIMPTLCGGKRR